MLLLIICRQIPKITLSGGFIDSWLGKLDKKVVTNLAIYFAKNNLSELVTNLASNAALNAKNKFERRISGKGAARAGKGFAHFIYFDWRHRPDIKSLKSFDGVTEEIKQEIKNRKVYFLLLY